VDIAKAAIKWKLSEGTVRKYCKKGLVRNAEIQNGQWQLPDETARPYVTAKKNNRTAEDDYFDILKALMKKQYIDPVTLSIAADDFSGMLEIMKESGWIKLKKGAAGKPQAAGCIITPKGIDFLNKRRADRINLLSNAFTALGKGFETAVEMMKKIPPN
jgi:hypothetical protein